MSIFSNDVYLRNLQQKVKKYERMTENARRNGNKENEATYSKLAESTKIDLMVELARYLKG